MSKKRYFDTNFWSDTWVETLNRDEKLFFIYLFTNDLVTIAGVYEIPWKRLVLESEFTKEEIVVMLKKMEAKVVYQNGWIVLRNAIKAQNYRNDKIGRGIKAILESCPVELLEFIKLPTDINFVIERPEPEPKQISLIHDSSMTLDSSLHLIKYNYNNNTNAPDKPTRGGSKELTEKQKKRNYAIAAQADRDQATRAKKRFDRKPSETPTKASDVKDPYAFREGRKS